MSWLDRRAKKLGGTPRARAQAQAEWERAQALLESVKRSEPGPKHYGRSGRLIEFDGQARTIAEWARHLGMARDTLWVRIKKWGVERALATPPRRYLKDN